MLRCLCDLCGKPTEQWEERGIYEKKQYCPDCLKVHDAMQAELATVHAKAARLFEAERETTIRKHFPQKGSAPDE